MRKNNLVPNQGLSLSQAQSVSNLCNQRTIEIARTLMQVNNFSKSIKIGDEEHILVKPNPLPTDVVSLISEKAKLHACQAFLMENIKAKDEMLTHAKRAVADLSSVEYPVKPKLEGAVHIPEVQENFGWEKLSAAELCEYHEAEAYAAHIGQFIHKDSILAGLRNVLPNIPAIEWMEIEAGKKTPVTITPHHDALELMKIHEELAGLHRQHEQRVNYFKAKVKNLTTEENARIAKLNADEQNRVEKINNDLQSTFDTQQKKVNEQVSSLKAEFEKGRQENIKVIASMRISVDPRFQETINLFLNKLPEEGK